MNQQVMTHSLIRLLLQPIRCVGCSDKPSLNCSLNDFVVDPRWIISVIRPSLFSYSLDQRARNRSATG